MIAALAAAVTGPRGRWVTIAAWVALAVAGFIGRSHIGDVTAAGQTSFLPKDAESTRALQALDESTSGGAARRPKRSRPSQIGATVAIGVLLDTSSSAPS